MGQFQNLMGSPSVRTFGRSFKDHTVLAIPLVLCASAIFLFSVLYDPRVNKAPLWSAIVSAVLAHWKIAALILGAYFLGAIAHGLAAGGWGNYTSYLWVPFKDRAIYVLVLLALLVMAGAWILSEKVAHLTESSNSGGLLGFIQSHPGGIFDGFMGVLTVLGFAFTLQGLWEIRSTITSFPDLNDRLCKMFDTTKSDETVHMVCYTPSLGFIALEEPEFEKFYERITGTKGYKPRAEMLCLREQDLKEWHNLFIGRKTGRGEGTVCPELADKATKKAEEIVSRIPRVKPDQESGTDNENKDTCSAVKRLPFGFMPGFYFFYNSQRAIVVAPLNLPFPKGAPKVPQKGGSSGPTVHMIGFETNDRGIIRELREVYKSYGRLPPVYLAELDQPMEVSDLEAWSKYQGTKIATAGQTLFEQFNAAKETQAHGCDKANQERAEAYRDYVSGENIKLDVMFRVTLREVTAEKAEQKAAHHG